MDIKMKQNKENVEQSENIILHFVNGNLQLNESTSAKLHIQCYMATVYADEYIGKIEGSDAVIGYNEEGHVWVTVENADGNRFDWSNWYTGYTDRKVIILFYVLAENREYLLYCDPKDFFCYLTIPEKDPRQDHMANIPNTHLNTTYHVLDELLQQTKQYSFKVIPRRLGD